ncbi:hypothetical protein ACHAQJ_009189 [Trichoderma viride]
MDKSNPPKIKPQSCTRGSTERRRLQNRQAQHNYRLREAAKAKQDKRINKVVPIRHDTLLLVESVHRSSPKVKVPETALPLPCGAHFASAQHLILSADHQLLTLVHNNIIRGLVTNANLLFYPWSTICQDNSLSSFCPHRPELNLPALHSSLPSCLQATALQRKEKHHPWLDLIPFPRFRENVLRRLAAPSQEEWDFETELCEDVTGAGRLQMSCSRPGFLLWGENSWDAHNWEVTDEFAQKWHDLLDGCWDLMASTNDWRKKRGETILMLTE